eukprot:3263054-Ditylum_brightwellii.AAC.1
MATFILNLFDQNIDLTDKEDQMLFKARGKGLDKDKGFDGTKDKFLDSQKLIGEKMKANRLIQCLNVSMEWTTVKPSSPGQVTNIFNSRNATQEQVEKHINLVWANTSFGPADTETLNYFVTCNPADSRAFIALRNQWRPWHVMLGNVLWNSLAINFQLVLLTQKSKFTKQENKDGVLSWDHIVRTISPSMKMLTSNLKDEIEKAVLPNFGYNIKTFNT